MNWFAVNCALVAAGLLALLYAVMPRFPDSKPLRARVVEPLRDRFVGTGRHRKPALVTRVWRRVRGVRRPSWRLSPYASRRFARTARLASTGGTDGR